MQNTFIASQVFTANQKGVNPISTWAGRFLPGKAMVRLLARSTTAGNQLTLNSGTRSIQPKSPVQSGGTAGVTPSELNTTPIEWIGFPGEEIMPLFDEVLGGTPTVDLVIMWTLIR